MTIANYDSEVEKRAHPENFKLDNMEEAADLIEELSDALSNLSYFSVRNDDIFNGEIDRMEQEVKNCRKQII